MSSCAASCLLTADVFDRSWELPGREAPLSPRAPAGAAAAPPPNHRPMQRRDRPFRSTARTAPRAKGEAPPAAARPRPGGRRSSAPGADANIPVGDAGGRQGRDRQQEHGPATRRRADDGGDEETAVEVCHGQLVPGVQGRPPPGVAEDDVRSSAISGLASTTERAFVQARSRRWVVDQVKPSVLPIPAMRLSAAGPRHLLAPASVEDDGLGEALQVVWEVEPGAKGHREGGPPRGDRSRRAREARRPAPGGRVDGAIDRMDRTTVVGRQCGPRRPYGGGIPPPPRATPPRPSIGRAGA